MTSRPFDTSRQAWELQRSVLVGMTGEARLEVALELSDVVRSLRVAGIRTRYPGWDDGRVVSYVIAEDYGMTSEAV